MYSFQINVPNNYVSGENFEGFAAPPPTPKSTAGKTFGAGAGRAPRPLDRQLWPRLLAGLQSDTAMRCSLHRHNTKRVTLQRKRYRPHPSQAELQGMLRSQVKSNVYCIGLTQYSCTLSRSLAQSILSSKGFVVLPACDLLYDLLFFFIMIKMLCWTYDNLWCEYR